MQYTMIRTLTAATLTCLVSTGAALAEKNPPNGSQPTDPQVIGKLYNGKTSYWDREGFSKAPAPKVTPTARANGT